MKRRRSQCVMSPAEIATYYEQLAQQRAAAEQAATAEDAERAQQEAQVAA